MACNHLVVKLQEISGLATQLAAERIECRESHCAGLVGLENGQVRQCHSESIAKFRERQPPLFHQPIERHPDRHVR